MKHQILVIDDMRSIFLAISQILTQKSCVVEYAENGNEGIKKAKSKQYDLVLLDIHMPGMLGLEVCRKLKKEKNYKNVPILFLTSDTHNLQEAIAAGGADYVLKPFKEIEILARVFTQIKRSKSKIKLVKEKNRLASDINTKEKNLNELNKDLDDYFYQTSHRLRAPLNTIKGLVNLLKIDHPETKKIKYIDLIDKWTDKLMSSNEQITTISNMRDYTPNLENYSLIGLITQVVQSINYKDVEFAVDVPKNISLHTDALIFKTGLEPILKNAAFYSIKNGTQQPPSIHYINENGAYFLIIQDHGGGIKPEILPHVMGLFYVGDTKSEGNGLGLFIAQFAFSLLGINVRIESEWKKQTRVKLNLSNIVT